MLIHGHLDLLSDEPGWLEETRVDARPLGSMIEADPDDEPTGFYLVMEADEPTLVGYPPPVPVPTRLAEGSGPVELRFDCGMTVAQHKEITADAIRREAELVKIGQQHDDRLGHHLQMANHPACGSTLSWPLPGHAPRSRR